MGFFDLLNHIANLLLAPAALAILLALCGRIFMKKRAAAPVLLAQAAINFVAGLAVVLAALVWTQHDGKMLMYGALVLVVATVQWWFQHR
ncbi:hypothetical protein KIK84_05030 [Curvibacter sp. CHRR-16]|uniref:hypothetical protein n=1 Tax=Curvibacter sp. CHRR-16 TaxID=2835872 RepID=UPI001BD9C7FD|nr:hypothetical protein [Curvibacter sp. CHRR-16]MBT0569678.1 hypothetical protein [Curvibacter sp. CHRR-16]